MKEIKLTGGQIAIVNDEDFKELNTRRWYLSNKGYPTRKDNRSGISHSIAMHRVILCAKAGECVDHVNHNRLDNRKSNLRICTQSQNQMNKTKLKGTSKHKGVYWNKTEKKWYARIKFNWRQYHLGTFTNEDDAGLAYNKKAMELHGEFTVLNKLGLKEGV